MKKHIHKLLFALYLCLMVYLLFVQRIKYIHLSPQISYFEMLSSSINLIPGYSVAIFVRNLFSGDGYWARHAVINLIGNVVMFVPAGFFLPMVCTRARRLKNTLLISLGALAVIETVQLFTLLGSMDIDDVILNMAGVLIGYALFKAYEKKD